MDQSYLILDRLNKDWETFLEWPFKGILKIFVTECNDGVFGDEEWLSGYDPVNGLTLWINHEWVSGGSDDHDTVLDGKIIWWKTFQVPFSYCGSVDQEISELEIFGYRNGFCREIIVEVLIEELGTEVGIEWTAIRNEGASKPWHISDQSLLQKFELVCALNPSLFVVLKGVNEPVGLVHLSP